MKPFTSQAGHVTSQPMIPTSRPAPPITSQKALARHMLLENGVLWNSAAAPFSFTKPEIPCSSGGFPVAIVVQITGDP